MFKILISFKILDILQDKNLHKAREIADNIEISERTVRWYMNELLDAGIQIESVPGRNGGYILRKNKFIK